MFITIKKHNSILKKQTKNFAGKHKRLTEELKKTQNLNNFLSKKLFKLQQSTLRIRYLLSEQYENKNN